MLAFTAYPSQPTPIGLPTVLDGCREPVWCQLLGCLLVLMNVLYEGMLTNLKTLINLFSSLTKETIGPHYLWSMAGVLCILDTMRSPATLPTPDKYTNTNPPPTTQCSNLGIPQTRLPSIRDGPAPIH